MSDQERYGDSSGSWPAEGAWPEAEQTTAEGWAEEQQPAGEGWPEADQTTGGDWQSGSGGEGDAGYQGDTEYVGWGYQEGQPGDGGVPGGAPEQVPCGEGPCPICSLQRQTSSQCILIWGHDGDHQCGYGDLYGVGWSDIPPPPPPPLCRMRCPTCDADPDPDKFKGECVRTLGHDGPCSYSCLHS